MLTKLENFEDNISTNSIRDHGLIWDKEYLIIRQYIIPRFARLHVKSLGSDILRKSNVNKYCRCSHQAEWRRVTIRAYRVKIIPYFSLRFSLEFSTCLGRNKIRRVEGAKNRKTDGDPVDRAVIGWRNRADVFEVISWSCFFFINSYLHRCGRNKGEQWCQLSELLPWKTKGVWFDRFQGVQRTHGVQVASLHLLP